MPASRAAVVGVSVERAAAASARGVDVSTPAAATAARASAAAFVVVARVVPRAAWAGERCLNMVVASRRVGVSPVSPVTVGGAIDRWVTRRSSAEQRYANPGKSCAGRASYGDNHHWRDDALRT